MAERLERAVEALANLARPYVLVAAATSSAVATVAIVFRNVGLIEGAAYIGAAWAGVAALYGAKALEERGKSKDDASVARARVTAVDAPVKDE